MHAAGWRCAGRPAASCQTAGEGLKPSRILSRHIGQMGQRHTGVPLYPEISGILLQVSTAHADRVGQERQNLSGSRSRSLSPRPSQGRPASARHRTLCSRRQAGCYGTDDPPVPRPLYRFKVAATAAFWLDAHRARRCLPVDREHWSSALARHTEWGVNLYERRALMPQGSPAARTKTRRAQ